MPGNRIAHLEASRSDGAVIDAVATKPVPSSGPQRDAAEILAAAQHREAAMRV